MTVYLDGAAADTPQALHAELARQLGLPDWYGRNLDALYDALGCLAGPVEIELRGLARLRSGLGDYFEQFLRVLADASRAGQEPIFLRLAPEELMERAEEE